MVPLLWVCERATPRAAFLWGWTCGLAFFATSLSWVTISMSQYGKLPWAVSDGLMLALCSYLALFFGAFGLGFRAWVRQFGLWGALLAPLLWVSLEMVRGRLFSGLPWSLLGYSQYRFLDIIQISDTTGVYGVSFLLALSNVALWGLLRRQRRGFFLAAFFLGVLAAAWAYGRMRLSENMVDPGRTIPVGVVQGNISMDQKWDESFRGETLKIYGRLSHRAAGLDSERPHLLVWPESAAPFLFEVDRAGREELLRTVRNEGAFLLFGSPAVDFSRHGSPLLYNSAYLVSPQGVTLSRYDKIHLVPFGEYVPLSGILSFVGKMVEGIGDFRGGTQYTLQSIDGTPFGTVICFEVIFPELVREFVGSSRPGLLERAG